MKAVSGAALLDYRCRNIFEIDLMSKNDPRPSQLPAAVAEVVTGVIPTSEALVHALLDTVPALMWSANPDGEPSYLNQRVVDYTGRSLKDFVKRGWTELIHPADLDETIEAWSHAVKTGGSYYVKHRLRRADGEYRWFLVRGEPFRGAEGRVVQFFGLNVDITEQEQATKALRKSEEEFRQIVDLSPQLVAVLGPKRERLYLNRTASNYLGISQDEWLRGSRGTEIHADDRERHMTFESRLSLDSTSETELRMVKSDGSHRWVLARFTPVCDDQGQLLRWYVAGTDIDDRKRLEERLQQENVALREEIDKTSMFGEILGTSRALIAALSRVSKVAASESTVLIGGETGTGKELVARAIHRRSRRSSRSFVAVNCAAIPRELIASELFGHEKGAFTGALQRRIGRFELADGGTLFLDEVGELAPDTQIALLRTLQEREFERVGGREIIRVDVRVIAATNRDLEAAIADGIFRQDLFYRLNVFPVEMPPLRERKEDIPLLVEYFVDRYARKMGKSFRRVNMRTLDRLMSYPWPGNVRELQNVIERSAIVCDSDEFMIDDSWLSASPVLSNRVVLPTTLAAHEKTIIEGALRECGGRVFGPTGAAARLGIPRSTLESKIRAHGIDKRPFRKRTAD
jgi:PAS domain S-box-containing protein